MRSLELKSNIHKIVDEIKNQQLLQAIYDFLIESKRNEGKGIWESLTDEQKQEILLAYEESENENNLVARDDVLSGTK